MSLSSSIFRITLIGLVVLALAMGIGRFAFTPLLPMMRSDGLISISEGGFLTAVHFLGYWLGAVFATKIPCPPKKLLQLSLFGIGIGTVAMGVTDEFTVWSTGRFLTGVCSAWSLVLVSNYYLKYLANNDRVGVVLQGWIFSGVGAGIAIAGLSCLVFMLSQISSALSWQIMGGASLLVGGIICFNMGAEIPAQRPVNQHRESAHSPLDWRIIIAYGVMGMGYIIPATYLPVMAREIVQSPLIFGWSWPIFGAAAFVSTIFAAKLHRRYSNRQLWAISQVVMAVGLMLPVFYPNILTIFSAGLCVGGTFMIITMTGMKEAHRIAPAHDVIRHIAVMTASFATGQMIGPVFASTVYDLTQSFAFSLVSTSVALIITAMTLMNSSAQSTAMPESKCK